MADVDHYFSRFGWCDRQLADPVPADLGMVVVIPCHDEPDLVGSLQSLQECDRPTGAVEVIVVLNAAQGSDVVGRNSRSKAEAEQWYGAGEETWFGMHLIEANELPRKHAGVGLARKIGMDEAVRRLADVGLGEEGVVVCYDADCRCDSNLLTAIEDFFARHPAAPGCSVRYEHPLTGELDPRCYQAITEYELHLRYYIEACRFAGHPFAFHTIGSSMAVQSGAYVKQGGMNRRQAGEDFYFLQKIIPLGDFGEINSTRVLPSPRISDRVPFGTGRAVGEYCQKAAGGLPSYPLRAFVDLRQFLAGVVEGKERVVPGELLQRFLEGQDFVTALAQIRSQTASPAAFRKRFFRWFDAFKLMKYVHFARDESYGAPSVKIVAGELWERIGDRPPADTEADLLEQYRRRQSVGWSSVLG